MFNTKNLILINRKTFNKNTLHIKATAFFFWLLSISENTQSDKLIRHLNGIDKTLIKSEFGFIEV